MKTISQKLLYQILFFVCVAIPFTNNYELTFAVWFLVAAVTVSQSYSLTIIKYIACYAMIFLIALVVSFFRDENTYNFFRDIAYLVKPILGLLIGYQLFKKFPSSFFSTVVYTGAFIATGHLLVVFFTFLKYHTVSVNVLRQHGGYFSDYEVYALIVLIFYKKFQNSLSLKTIRILTLILALSSFLYLSRTNFIQFILLYFAMKGYFVMTKRTVMVGLSTIVLTIAGYTAIYHSNPSRSGKGLEAFMYKIKIAPIEAFKRKVDPKDWKDFNDNYRSYENIITMRQVSHGGFPTIAFGKGLGATINLGQRILTTDETYVQFLPTLHNGFATVYLKSGVLGVFFLVLSLVLLARNKKSDIPEVKYINMMLVGTCIFLIVSNWVFMGLYLKLDNKSILIGALVCYREILIKRHNNRNKIV